MATCTLSTLLSSGKCFCGVTNNPYEIAKLQLLCEINAVLTGGAVGGVQVYDGADADPNGVVTPANTAQPAIYYQNPSVTPYNVWFWNAATLSWNQFSSPS